MVAHLRGQVTIDLAGRIDSFKGGIRTTFDHVPDVPVTQVRAQPAGRQARPAGRLDQPLPQAAAGDRPAQGPERPQRQPPPEAAQRRLPAQAPPAGTRPASQRAIEGTGAGRVASAPVRPSLSVLIVAWNSRAELAGTLPPLLAELREGDELIVVDNDSARRHAAGGRASWRRRRGWCAMGRNAGFAAACNAGAEEAERRPARPPQPRRGAAAGLGRGDPPALARGPRLGRLAGAGRRRGRRRDQLGRQPGPLHRHRLGRDARAAARRGAAGRRGRLPLRRLPGDPAARPGARLGGFPEPLLPLPRGRRPLAAAAAARRDARDRAGGGRRPRLRVRRPRAQVALAGAQPPRLPRPRLPGAAAGCCWRRRWWRPSWRCSSSPPAAAGASRSSPPTAKRCAGCRACCASGAGSSAAAPSPAPSSPPG